MPKLLLIFLKTLLLCTLFTTIASSYSNEKQLSIDKSTSLYRSRKSVDTTVFFSDSMVKYVKELTSANISNNKQHYNDTSVEKTHEQPIKTAHVVKQTQSSKLSDAKISQTIKELFKLDDRPGLRRLDMSSEEMLSDEPETWSTKYVKSELPYSVKVQRSPDGKLKFVVNDLVSLQTDITQEQHNVRKPASDTFHFPTKVHSKPPPAILTTPTAIQQVKCEDSGAVNKTFCKKISHYPNLESLRSVLSSDFASFFGNDLPEPEEIGSRMDDGFHEEYLCNSQATTIYPEWGQTSDNGGQIIINSKEHKQGVRIEECTNPGITCRYLESIPNGYYSQCKQHYTYRVLASLTTDGDVAKVTKQNFKFPSCCKCSVRPEKN